MNNITKCLLGLISLIIWNCTDQEHHSLVSYIENKSGYPLSIQYYKNGFEDSELFLSINNNEIKFVEEDNNSGKTRGPSYPSRISGMDSSIILFSAHKKAVHYGYQVNGNNPDAILSDSPRSIFNRDNYIEKILFENNRKIRAEYTFTFTEQDYLDAKE